MAVRNGLASHSQWNPDNAALFVYEIDLRLSLQRKLKLRQGQSGLIACVLPHE